MKGKSAGAYVELKSSHPQLESGGHAFDYEPATDPAEHIYGLQYTSYQSSSSLATQGGAAAEDKNSKRIALAAVAALLTLAAVLLSLGANQRAQHGLSRGTAFKSRTHPLQPSLLWGTVQKPYPTGAFWTNLVVDDGLLPVQMHPYGVAVRHEGVQVSYGAAHRMVSQAAISDVFMPDLQLSSLETPVSRYVERYDNLSVTMAYRLKSGQLTVPLVKGSPFITVVYENATPVISSIMHFTAVDPRSMDTRSDRASEGVAKSVAYELTLGSYQRWLLYCSQPLHLTRNGDSLVAAGPITGYCRVAVIPIQSGTAGVRALLGYAPRYPTGGSVSIHHRDDYALVSFAFGSAGSGPLLMMALPHHSRVLEPADEAAAVAAASVASAYSPVLDMKGRLQPVVGDSWTLKYPRARVGWGYDTTLNSEPLTERQLSEIRSSLAADLLSVPPTAADPYGFGKEVARMAGLALLAEQVDMPEARSQALAATEKALLPWLQGENGDALLYDSTYGGIVSTNGLADASSDFGSGWYNDHHFHYGYFVYASAVVARMDPAFWLQHKVATDALVRDFCNPDPLDPSFPFARHKDLFEGHSWASGIVPQANGKSQESSSEAVNAYYSVHLYGVATGDSELARFGSLMMSMELLSASLYWHMTDSAVYDGVFAATRMVGNVGALDVTSSTWFGNEPEYVHGINIMPVTPATALLLAPPFVAAAYPVLARALPPPVPEEMQLCSASHQCTELGMTGRCCPTAAGAFLACCDAALTGAVMGDEWRSLIYLQHAVIDKDAAWSELAAMQNYGQGGSRANALMWTATRARVAPNATQAMPSSDPLASIDKACSANSACVAQGLESGDCCPTLDPHTRKDLVLGCCPLESKLAHPLEPRGKQTDRQIGR